GGMYSTPLDAAQVLLVPGELSATRVRDLKEVDLQRRVGMRSGTEMAVQSADNRSGARPGQVHFSFDRVAPGRYSLCVIPLGDLKDLEYLHQLERSSEDLPIHCSRLEVAAAPTPQRAEVEVPPPSAQPLGDRAAE
ncbi:MAG: hypothetical protein AAGC55_16245, partial [Myxococcota bacterium]